MNQLNEEHTDLLGLLAQQELELAVFRKALIEQAPQGAAAARRADERARALVGSKYGAYIDYRQNVNMSGFSDGA